VVARLDEVVQAVDSLRSAQESTSGDLAALFPALLDRACHGELSGEGIHEGSAA